ncbi:MAG: tetratricopeptide repeat protein [Bacteroidetes bacterium]|nr:tetratricopeptide repeat protein [Bacteroidota bacterium]
MKKSLLLLLFSGLSILQAQLAPKEHRELMELVGIPSANAELKLNFNANDLEGKPRDPIQGKSVAMWRKELAQKPNDPEVMEKLAAQIRMENPASPEPGELLDKARTIRFQNFDDNPSMETLLAASRHYQIFRLQPDTGLSILSYAYDKQLVPGLDQNAEFYNHVSGMATYAQNYDLAYSTSLKAFELDPTDTEVLVQRGLIEYFKVIILMSKMSEEELKNIEVFSMVDTSFLAVALQEHPNKNVVACLSRSSQILFTMMQSIMDVANVGDRLDSVIYEAGWKVMLSPEEAQRIEDARKWFLQAMKAKKVQPFYAYQALMIAAWLQNDLPGARKYFDLAVKIDPKFGQLYQNMAFIYLMNNKWEEAIAIIKRFPEAEQSALVQQLLASKYHHLKRYTEAAAAAAKVEKLAPRNDDMALLIVWKQLYDGRYAEARTLLDKVKPIPKIRESKDFQLYDVCTDLLMGKVTDARFKAKIAIQKHDEFPTMEKLQAKYLAE